MKDFYQKYLLENLWFHIFSFASLALIIASFIVPPMGLVDPSVLAAIGELFAFASLGAVIKAIDKGGVGKVKHGQTEVELKSHDKEETE